MKNPHAVANILARYVSASNSPLSFCFVFNSGKFPEAHSTLRRMTIM